MGLGKGASGDHMTQPMLAVEGGPQWAFERYEEVRSRLPSARFATSSKHCGSLSELIDRFDAFLFDSFGVLNVGDMPVPGATACIEALRRAGKQVMVLTNAATGSIASLPGKYSQLGFDFTSDEIVSSRQVLAMSLAQLPLADWRWAVAAPRNAAIEEIIENYSTVDGRSAGLADVDGFILLSTSGWNKDHASAIRHALRKRPRPVLVGNPDLVAPREGGLSLEPGSIAHDLLDEIPGLDVRFFGKPFGNAFDEALRRLPSAHPHAALARGCDLVANTLTDHLAFELGKAQQDVQGQPTHGRRGVERLGDADEGDAMPVEDLDQPGKVHQRATETIDLVDHDDIDEPVLDIR